MLLLCAPQLNRQINIRRYRLSCARVTQTIARRIVFYYIVIMPYTYIALSVYTYIGIASCVHRVHGLTVNVFFINLFIFFFESYTPDERISNRIISRRRLKRTTTAAAPRFVYEKSLFCGKLFPCIHRDRVYIILRNYVRRKYIKRQCFSKGVPKDIELII